MFRDLFIEKPQLMKAGKKRIEELTFREIDEFAFALFIRYKCLEEIAKVKAYFPLTRLLTEASWIYGAMLSGPSDFHTMQHYVCLYALAIKFRIERLQNEVMDGVRAYYRTSNMTSPPARLQYIYENTKEPNHMRTFLVNTAAYRVLCQKDPALSSGMRYVSTFLSYNLPVFPTPRY